MNSWTWTSWYQQLILPLTEVYVIVMSSCMALYHHRFGHLMGLYNTFAYLAKHHNVEIISYPSDPDINWLFTIWKRRLAILCVCYWGLWFEGCNMPEPRGKGMTMRLNVDSNHAGHTKNWRPRIGFLVYLQCILTLYWISKKQTSVETSSFWSEFYGNENCYWLLTDEYVLGLI